MPTRLIRNVIDQLRQWQPSSAIRPAILALAGLLLVSGIMASVLFFAFLAGTDDDPGTYRSVVTFFTLSCMILFVPLAFLLCCCALKQAGPLFVSFFAAISLLHIAGWHAFIGADTLRFAVDIAWELRMRAYGFNCFSVDFPIGA